MRQYSRYVARTLKGLQSGAENKMRSGESQIILEAPCVSCGIIIRWNKCIPVNAHGVSTAFSE